MASSTALVVLCSVAALADALSDTAIVCILQDIAAVGRHLEAMDSKIIDLSTGSNSMWADIASFQDKVTDLDHPLTDVKGQLAMLPEWYSELQFLCSKLMDLEDRSPRDQVCFFLMPDCKEGTYVRVFLRELLSDLTGLVFTLTLEFQEAYRIGPPVKLTQENPAHLRMLPPPQTNAPGNNRCQNPWSVLDEGA
ncbi:hypothetical protein NDU88_003246 [Pleurodeles waltl]|uniref:Uncharacterized protein n=1 Tax=Pleurodeles waltl TaxID=8319 RepID=A0AAV7RI07_PLEWA|nr:hypothetical protein NDU88_003246 [Pleurodeles waltl]